MSRSFRSGESNSSNSTNNSSSAGTGYHGQGSHSHTTKHRDGPLSLVELKDHLKRNNRIKEYQGHSAKVHSVDWSSDGRRLASGSFDKSVCVFLLDGTKLRQDHVFRGHTDSVDQLCWHATNPDLLGTASGDKTVRIWDARTQKSVDSIPTKGENINISWSPDGNSIAVGNKEDLITFIDVRTGKISLEVPFKFEVNEICWNPSSDLFFLTNGEGCIYIHSYPDMQVQQILKAHPANCICIEFHPKGEYFAVGSADAVVSLWDFKELACVRTFTRLDWPVRAISFNHDGTLIASASEDLTIDIAHVDTGEQVAEITVDSPTFTVAFHPSKNILAFACDDKDKYDRDRDTGTLKLYGLPCD
ncbi:unnamed protein product [Allacma fusca]|uniref:THO complex subunit 3 n=1 Tax=Allacma fusca TaxID=39272 RepID=A0A8J2K713_9HEXA|nr:unnamed protein product [Allacma fusca]